MPIISINELLAEAVAREQEEHASSERKKLGTLRAGNSGAMIPGKKGKLQPVGACPRTAHLRTLGIDIETPTDDKLLMWAGGFLNEEYWYQKLAATWSGTILREEEIPIEWLSGDVKVTGRPDLILCEPNSDGSPHPVMGIELKGMASIWTARDVSFSQGVPQGPKMPHLCQAGHYSWKLGEQYNNGVPLPYRIIYTSYVNFSSPLTFASNGTKEAMEPKMFPRPGEPGSEKCDYGDSGWLKNVKPHHMIYEIKWEGQPGDPNCQLKFREEGSDTWTMSPITWAGIQMFYDTVREVPRDLGERPLTLSSSGTKLNYTICGYCPLEGVCTEFEGSGYHRWIQAVRRSVMGR